VLSRIQDLFRPSPELERSSRDKLLEILVKFMISYTDLKIIPDKPETNKLNKLEIFHMYSRVIELARVLKLRTLDLLHLAYAIKFHEEGLINIFATLDKDILSKKDIIEKKLRVEIVDA